MCASSGALGGTRVRCGLCEHPHCPPMPLRACGHHADGHYVWSGQSLARRGGSDSRTISFQVRQGRQAGRWGGCMGIAERGCGLE